MQKDSQAGQKVSFYTGKRGILLQAVLLMVIWLLLSGHYDLLHIFYGVLSVVFVIFLNYRMHYVPLAPGEMPGSFHIKIPKLIGYLFWLQWQIIQSGVYVAYIVLHPKMPINPMLVRFRSKQPNVLAQVILGNSITLTPGTVTLDIKDDVYTVHALTRDTEEGLVSGEMEAKVARLYLDECEPGDACSHVELITSGRGL
ncbi:MAG: Na+/H+ antiporter subunit E [Desulfovibrionales bacterium]